VLCSNFNNAPAAEASLLLERAKEAGIRILDLNACLLVLPRPEEALAVKDESGIRVETLEEGYELKGEQVAMALEPLGLQQFAIEFYNAKQDDSARLHDFLIQRLSRVREAFRERIREITNNAQMLLLNYEKEEVQEVLHHAAAMLQTWASQNSAVPAINAHVQDSLMTEIAKAYASTIHATVLRKGEWLNLSYSHHLGYGARRIAALLLGKSVDGFLELCKTMVGTPDYNRATDLIQQAARVLQSSYEEMLRKVQLMGQTAFRDELKLDADFWGYCFLQWGRGPGYRDRVASRNDQWFTEKARLDLEKELRALIEREWTQTLERITALFEKESRVEASPV